MPLINGQFAPIEIPKKHFDVLTSRCDGIRFRALWGGRNGAKDWSMAAQAVELGLRTPKRFLFTREVQKTLDASAKQLLEDTIKRLGYKEYFTVKRDEITCNINETVFLFAGLNDIVASDLKSFEGIDIAVICEAEDLTKKSFDIFNFTIRKPKSEIWIQFNPQFEDDFVYDFCVTNPPDNLIGCCVNGFALSKDERTVLKADNPWVSPEQIKEAQRLLETDRDAFNNQCLGLPKGQGGRVYPMYSKDIHEIDFDFANLPQCDLYMSIDPARKYYPAITWYAVTPTNAIVVYNEWPRYETLGMWFDEARHQRTFDMSLKELAAVILANDMTFKGGRVVGRIPDPRFANENPDFVRTLMEHGVLNWIDAPFELIETQRDNLKTLMAWNPAIPLCGSNTPDWYVHNGCTNKSRAYRRHCYAEDKDKESEEHKDFIDGDRYFLSVFPKGRPLYINRDKIHHVSALKPLSEVQLNALPATGYYSTPKK